MKKGATPSNYKTVVQQRLIQDIFKTPHQPDDELSEDDLLTTDQHKTFEGADNATIPLASKTSPASVPTSTPVLQRFVPRRRYRRYYGIKLTNLHHQQRLGHHWGLLNHSASRPSLGWCHHQVPYQQRRFRYQRLQELHHSHQVQVRTLIFLIRHQI